MGWPYASENGRIVIVVTPRPKGQVPPSSGSGAGAAAAELNEQAVVLGAATASAIADGGLAWWQGVIESSPELGVNSLSSLLPGSLQQLETSNLRETLQPISDA